MKDLCEISNREWIEAHFIGNHARDLWQLSRAALASPSSRATPSGVTEWASTCKGDSGKLSRLSLNIHPSAYSVVLYDRRLSHGAFRLWHLLRDRTGKNDSAWPSIRSMAKDLSSGIGSVALWIKELESAKYLRIQRGNQRRSSRYFLLSFHSERVPVDEHRVSRTERRVPVAGTELIPVKPTPLKGSGRALSGSERISLETERKRLAEELKRTMCDCPTDEEKARRRWVRDRISKIEQATHIEL